MYALKNNETFHMTQKKRMCKLILRRFLGKERLLKIQVSITD